MTLLKENPVGRVPKRGNELGVNGSLLQAEDVEKNILGLALQNPSLIERLCSQLAREDFYSSRHQIIFGTMLEMKNEGTPVDILSVSNALEKKGELERMGCSIYLIDLYEFTRTYGIESSLDSYIKNLKEASRYRNLDEKTERLKQAIRTKADKQTISNLGTEIEKLCSPGEFNGNIISLVDYKPKEMAWLLEKALPDKFPSTIYGDGGLGKSYLGLYLAILAALGNQSFLGLHLPQDSLNVLYLDWELDVDEFSRRALMIARGSGLSKIPNEIAYIMA